MPTDQHTRLFALMDELEPEYQDDFLRLVSHVRNERTLDEMEDLLSRGMVAEALGALQNNLPAFADDVVAGFITSGTATAGALTGILDRPVGFNQTSPFVLNYMRENRQRLISQFSQEQEAATRRAITSGIITGRNPREQAVAFRDSIGLTERQVGSVERYKLLLTNLDRDALERQLRDRRFDETVRRAINSETPLTTAQINRMVERYRSRMLGYRAARIAQSEALRGVNAGSYAMYRQLVEDGVVAGSDLERVWRTAGDSHVRSTHVSMNGQVVGMDEDFISGSGARLRYPGDPQGGAAETVGCRCAVATRINRSLLENA